MEVYMHSFPCSTFVTVIMKSKDFISERHAECLDVEEFHILEDLFTIALSINKGTAFISYNSDYNTLICISIKNLTLILEYKHNYICSEVLKPETVRNTRSCQHFTKMNGTSSLMKFNRQPNYQMIMPKKVKLKRYTYSYNERKSYRVGSNSFNILNDLFSITLRIVSGLASISFEVFLTTVVCKICASAKEPSLVLVYMNNPLKLEAFQKCYSTVLTCHTYNDLFAPLKVDKKPDIEDLVKFPKSEDANVDSAISVKCKEQIKQEIKYVQVYVKDGKSSHKLYRPKKRFKSSLKGKKPIFPCSYCKKTYLTRRKLNKHELRFHLWEKPRQCFICKNSFKRDYYPSHHSLLHQDGKPVCMQCGMNLAKERESSKFIHRCDYCEKAFCTKNEKDEHEQTHVVERPYHCSYCEKSFPHSKSLKQHETVNHFKEKTHKCQFCDKTYLYKCHKEIHERTHTGEKPYGCSHCERSFSTYSGVKKHEKTHRLAW